MINSTLLKGIFSKCSLILVSLISISSLAQTYVASPYYTGFESGLGPEWTTTSSLATNGILPVQSGTLTWSTQTAYSHTGNYFLGMHYPTGGAYNLNQADLHLNLAGESNLRLDFWWAEWNDETEPQDGVYISDDGGATFTKVLDLPGANYTDLVYTHFDMSLDSINTLYGLSFSSTYIVRLQQYDNYYFAGGNDGFLFDDLNVYQTCSTSSSLTASVCGSYMAPSGTIYTTSGLYSDTIMNTTGCDSIISIDLTVAQPTTNLLTISTCSSYTSPAGNTYTTSGTFNDTIPNASGCDSVITIDLTINQPSASYISESTCYSYNSPAGNTYTSTGVYYDTITTVAGCDSIVTIDLTINQATASSITETALDTYTSPSGNVYTTSGIYYDTIPNAAGCDSIITIDLTMQYTGIEKNGELLVSLFPNPASNVIHLSGIEGFEDKVSMKIVTAEGRIVKELSPKSEIDVTNLANGSYFLIIQTERGRKELHFVKQ